MTPSAIVSVGETGAAIGKALGTAGPATGIAEQVATHTKAIAQLFDGTNVSFIDAGIDSLPPGKSVPNLYVSGPVDAEFNSTDGVAFNSHRLGPEIGRTSGIKMTGAAITKGVNALLTASLQGRQSAWVCWTSCKANLLPHRTNCSNAP